MERPEDNIPVNYHHNRRFVSGIVLSIAGFAVSVNALPPLVTVLAASYAVTPGLFGIVFFFQYISFTLSSSAGGFIYGKGKGNPVIILVTSLILAGIIISLLGIVPSFILLAVCMTVIGGLGGIVESTGTMILSNEKAFPGNDEKKLRQDNTASRLVYVSQLFYCLGALFTPMIIGFFLARNLKVSLIGITVGILTIGIALAVLGTTRENRDRLPPRKFHSIPIQGSSQETIIQDKPPQKTFILFLSVMFLYVMLETSIGSWLPTYLETTFSVSPSLAAFHLTIFWAGLAATRFLYIFIHFQTIRTQLMIQIAGILISASTLLIASVSPSLRSIFIFILGLSCGPIWPLIINLYSQYYSRKHFVMYLVSAGSAGALTGILVTSTVVEFVGIESMMYVIFLYSLFLAIGYSGLFRGTRISKINR